MRWEAWILTVWHVLVMMGTVSSPEVSPRGKMLFIPVSLGFVWLTMRLGGAL